MQTSYDSAMKVIRFYMFIDRRSKQMEGKITIVLCIKEFWNSITVQAENKIKLIFAYKFKHFLHKFWRLINDSAYREVLNIFLNPYLVWWNKIQL